MSQKPCPAFTHVCECGNRPDLEGFYECDSEGRQIAESGLLCCERCGKIVERITGAEAGHRSYPAMSSGDTGGK